MTRKFLVLIFSAFTFAAIGIILLQVVQTRRSIAVSNSLFNISVTNAMDDIVPQLEQLSTRQFDYTHLDSIISEELLVNGINISPHVAITNASLDEIIYCSKPGIEKEILNSPYKYSYHLQGAIESPDYFITLFFPPTPLLQRDARMVTYISIFLLLVIIILFAISTSTISRQRKLGEMKTDFINNMTHEIKTPLATISLACEMLRDPTISTNKDQEKNFLNIINDETHRLRILVDTILQSAKMSNKTYTLNVSEVHMHNIIQQVAHSFKLSLDNKQGKITTILNADPETIYADPLHMTNLIHNLVDNAIKYSPSNPDITITTNINKDEHQFLLSVADHGIGISAEDQRHIFEKFYRVSTGNVHNVKGFGIGLNYVAQVVKLHHGTISINSELGEGTTFTIALPL